MLRKVNDSNNKAFEKNVNLCRNYIAQLLETIQTYRYDQIINYDEAQFKWEVRSKWTYDYKVVSSINTTKLNKAVTVCLMVRVDGFKYTAMVIFSEKKRISSSIRDKLTIPDNIYETSSISSYLSIENLKIIIDYIQEDLLNCYFQINIKFTCAMMQKFCIKIPIQEFYMYQDNVPSMFNHLIA